MKLEGGERLVLKTLLDLQGDSGDYVEDARLAAAAKMLVSDVRDWLETLEGKGFVERTRQSDGLSAYVTGKGKQALRMFEPIPGRRPDGEGDGAVSKPAPSTGSSARPSKTPAPKAESGGYEQGSRPSEMASAPTAGPSVDSAGPPSLPMSSVAPAATAGGRNCHR